MTKITLPIEEERFFQIETLFASLWALAGILLVAVGAILMDGPLAVLSIVFFILGASVMAGALASRLTTTQERKQHLAQMGRENPLSKP